jgi:hypothetical protein
MTTPLRTHILVAGLLWSALVLALPPAANAGQILGAPTYIGLTSGLVGYWSLDGKDVAGLTAYDRSGQGNHGTLTNGPARSVGKIGQALEFDQTDDYVSLGNMDVAGSAMTISAWVYRRAVPNGADCWDNDDCRIIDKSVGTSEQNIYWMLSTIWDGSKAVLRARLSTSGTTNTLIATSGEVKDGEWTHAVMRYDGSTLKLYKDSAEVGSMSKTGPIDTNDTRPAAIGAAAFDESLNWWGKIDDVRIYNRALSTDEIKRLYKIGSTEKFGAPNSSGSLASGLVAWWTFDGKDTSLNNSSIRTAVDRAGGNYHAISGDPIGGASAARAPAVVLGKLGQAFDFDGTNDTMVATAASLGQTTSRTISAWVYPESFGPGALAGILERVSEEIEWGFGLDNTGTTDGLTFYQNCTTPMQVFAANSITLNKWQHVLVTYSGGCANTSVTFYVDGAEKTRSGASGSGSPPSDSGTLFEISSDSSDQYYFDGRIDDLRLYNRVLTTDEIKRLYKMGDTLKQGVASNNGLLAKNFWSYWSFDGKDVAGSSGLTIYDRATNGAADTGTTSASGPRLTIGKIGQAFDFDGVDDYVSFSRTPQEQCIENDNGMFAAWVRPTGDPLSAATVYNLPPVLGELGGYMGIFRGSFGGEDRIWVYNDGGSDDQVGFTYTPDEWVHVAWVHSGGVLSAYKNGVLAGSTASGNTQNFFQFRIGTAYRTSTNLYFKGQIDDVRCYWPAPSPDEIKRLYNMGR